MGAVRPGQRDRSGGHAGGGYPIFKEAVENVVERKMTMELSMTKALLAALVIGEFFTALIITLFVLGTEILEGMTVRRGRRAIGDLLDFLPRVARVRCGGEIRGVRADEIWIGDLVLVNPAGRIPVDGTVAGGHSRSFPRSWGSTLSGYLGYFLTLGAVSSGSAFVTWHLLEKHCLRLRRFFGQPALALTPA
jgi:hypothetical protein